MKYLFFDIECSNCFDGIGKMCEFGYVLTDENLITIKHGDIPMSPGKGRENRFHLTGRKNERDLVLAYSYDYYLSSPEFPVFYNQIKKLMEDPDTICFAYSMDNDIPHLYNACKRYKLEPFNYTCYDVQKLVAAYLERKGQMGLHAACKAIVGPNSIVRLQEHLSRDDAEMERLILDAICILTKKKPFELLDESKFASTNSNEYMVEVKERSIKKQQRTAGYELFYSSVAPLEEFDKKENVGRRYNISGELKSDLPTLKTVINLIKEKNGIICNIIDKTDCFIVRDAEEKEKVTSHFKYPFNGQILTYKELLSTL